MLKDTIEGEKVKSTKKVYILSIENSTKFMYYLTLHAEKNFHSVMQSMEL